jgi:ketosteroid isomerase-like protein
MSRENVEVVRRAYALWSGDDVESALALSRPEVEVAGRSSLDQPARGSPG